MARVTGTMLAAWLTVTLLLANPARGEEYSYLENEFLGNMAMAMSMRPDWDNYVDDLVQQLSHDIGIAPPENVIERASEIVSAMKSGRLSRHDIINWIGKEGTPPPWQDAIH